MAARFSGAAFTTCFNTSFASSSSPTSNQGAAKGHAGGEKGGVMLEARAAGGDRLLEAFRAAVFLREGGKND